VRGLRRGAPASFIIRAESSFSAKGKTKKRKSAARVHSVKSRDIFVFRKRVCSRHFHCRPPVHILTSNNGIMIIYYTCALAKKRFRAAVDVIIAVHVHSQSTISSDIYLYIYKRRKYTIYERKL